MNFPVSRAQVLASSGTTLRTIRITALPGAPAAALLPQTDIKGVPIGGGAMLTLNDVATLSAAAVANQIYSAPLGALTLDQTINVPTTTSNGLAVSAVPAGVATIVDFG
jgi:hypothetical protein